MGLYGLQAAAKSVAYTLYGIVWIPLHHSLFTVTLSGSRFAQCSPYKNESSWTSFEWEQHLAIHLRAKFLTLSKVCLDLTLQNKFS